MTIQWLSGKAAEEQVVVYPVVKGTIENAELGGIKLRPSMGERGSAVWLYGRDGEPNILVVGLGDAATAERLREAAGTAGRALNAEKAAQATVRFELADEALRGAGVSAEAAVTAWVEGQLLGTYAFDAYKAKKSGTDRDRRRLRRCGSWR